MQILLHSHMHFKIEENRVGYYVNKKQISKYLYKKVLLDFSIRTFPTLRLKLKTFNARLGETSHLFLNINRTSKQTRISQSKITNYHTRNLNYIHKCKVFLRTNIETSEHKLVKLGNTIVFFDTWKLRTKQLFIWNKKIKPDIYRTRGFSGVFVLNICYCSHIIRI